MRREQCDSIARGLSREGRQMRKLAAAFLFTSIVSLGSTGWAEAQTYRFSSISVTGNQVMDDDSVIALARIVRNRSMTAAELNAAYQRVSGTGFFRTVDFTPSGNQLVISVSEYPLIGRVAIEGNRRLNNDRLTPLLRSRSGGVYSPSQAESDANAIAEAYAGAGRLAARVTPRLIERPNGRVDLVFEVVEGGVVEVERISFVGNRSFSERRLRNAISGNQAGRLSTLFRSDNYSPERVSRDRQMLQDFYLSRGFIDVQVLSGVTELSRERDGAFVTFTIREGQQYRVGAVSVVSEIDGIDAAPYQAALNNRSGDLFTPSLLESMIQQTERVGYRAGERFVRAEPRLSRNERDGTIDVELALVRGDRVFIERIDVRGNTTTQDQVIRRQFRVAEGDPLNPRELREAAARIERTGFFSQVQVNPTQGSAPSQAVVDVRVEETTTGSLGFGISYGTSAGVGANISYNESNFLGRGQAVNLTLSTVPNARALSFSITDPAYLGRDLALGLSFGLNSTTANTTSRYNTQIITFAPSLTFPVSDYGRMAVRYTLQSHDLTVPGIYLASISPRIGLTDPGRVLTSSIGFTFTQDTRLNGPDPDGGYVLRFSGDVAGLGGDRRWARATVLAGVERRVLNGDVTLTADFEAGAVAHSSGASRINERFALTSDQFRGFAPYGVGPVGYGGAVTDRNGLGGNFFAVARFEAQFPLGLPADYNMRGGLFVDVGSVWGVDAPGATCAVPTANCVIDDSALRATAGFALLWGSPMGPLRLNFTTPLRAQAYDETRRFDLTVATRF